MRKRIYRSYNEKINSKNIEKLLSTRSIKIKINKKTPQKKSNKVQNLLERIFSLDVLLKTIKSFQNQFFLKISETNGLLTIKQMLISLKDSLSLMNVEKKKKYENIKNINENNKKEIQDILFQENPFDYNDNLAANFVRQKNELQFINFQIENDIQKTNFLIEQKFQINLYLKSIPFFFDTNKEIFCNINYENYENISDILKEITRSVREEFIAVVKDKMETEIELNAVTFKINSIKDNKNKNNNGQLNSQKKYIDSEEVIYEESKEQSKILNTNTTKRNSYASLHKLCLNKKLGNLSSKNVIKKHTSIDSLMREKILKNFSLYHKISDIYQNSSNQINNYLNMNINVNINLNNNGINKYHYSTSSLEDDAAVNSDEYEDQCEIQLDENNIIIKSPVQSEENSKDNDDSYKEN